MADFDFPGGIHPPERKTLSNRVPLVQAPLPGRVILPLTQHLGMPAEPVVTLGQRVRTGEVIGRAQGMISANLHASITGTVSAIEEHPVPHPSATLGEVRALCIVIDADSTHKLVQKDEGSGELRQKDEGLGESRQKDEGFGELKQKDDWLRLPPLDWRASDDETLIERLRESGIVGLGGAGFPTSVKAQVRQRHAIDTLIVNVAECEPYITADDMTLRHYTSDILEGTQLFARLTGAERILIGIEDNKPEAIEVLNQALRKPIADDIAVELKVVATRYPSGGEKQLVQLLTGREVPSRGLPTDVGVLCHNPGTLLAALRAVRDGEPLISRIVTLTGEALDRPGNVEARIGTPMQELLAFAGLKPERLSQLIQGGPMMGFTLDTGSLPLIKTSNCLIAATAEELPPAPPEQPCIRCGACETACPASLLPQQLYWFAKGREHDKAELFNLFDCIECGACAYVCPSHIPLVQYYRASKSDIRAREQEARKAEHARHRFEFRQARIVREEAEKQARREARKKRPQDSSAQAANTTESDSSTARSEPAPTTADLTAQLRKLKIAQAAARAAVKKAEKNLARISEARQSDKTELEDMEIQLATARENLQATEARLTMLQAQSQDQETNPS
ncbi:electron transport complex subunit RsxC [Halomonas sp. PR-M31]|uniref:electron transport complex subunit RsxC n=1 Tax=Halomonas sp. PR-M31 TaxID=1471202 RepID=UPI00065249B0|nr:electron transport complex subunit RsxC [Halomonas sp. PR-M31]